MNVTQIAIGRFHHFHLARQLEKHGLLKEIWTGYPRFKLKDEQGIPQEKIQTFPWLQTPFMARGRLGLDRWNWLNREWAWHAHQTLDRHVAKKIDEPGVLFALSGSGLVAGQKMQHLGGRHVCDRGSSHIQFQDDILREEYNRWGLSFKGVDPRSIDKEQREYESSDAITIPSEFVRQSFLSKGLSENKLRKIPYGARLDRFKRVDNPAKDCFSVLWVGAVSVRKAFIDALNAFKQLKHSNKKFVVVGAIESQMIELLRSNNVPESVVFLGSIPNKELVKYYSRSHVFVIPSVEEGLAMVQGEALACGCPVIASEHTGASDLFENAKEGFIVPIRRPDLIAERLQQLADEPELREQMSQAALHRVQQLGGWDTYGDQVVNCLHELWSPK